jgi:hypothetical protein
MYGDLLMYCDPVWIQTLASGTNWIVAGIICAIVNAIIVFIVQANLQSLEVQAIAISAVFGLVSLIGYWKVTTPDPSKPDEEQRLTARKLTRIIYLTTFVVAPIQQLIIRHYPVYVIPLSLLVTVLGIVGTLAIFTYARQLALRIPDYRLAQQTRTVMWGLVFVSVIGLLILLAGGGAIRTIGTAGSTPGVMLVIAGIGCVVGVTSLVFGIWSIILLFGYRRRFHEAAGHAEATWSGAGDH